jgi:hypothetical protein
LNDELKPFTAGVFVARHRFVMKKLLLLIAVLVLSRPGVFCQTDIYLPGDTAYAGLSFSFDDDLALWSYKITRFKKNWKIPGLAQVEFIRSDGWDDAAGKEFHSKWIPDIIYTIFELKDSMAARQHVNAGKAYNCPRPYAGGDYFEVGGLIFVLTAPCTACSRKGSNVDVCRATINKIFRNIDRQKIRSLSDLKQMLPISGQ